MGLSRRTLGRGALVLLLFVLAALASYRGWGWLGRIGSDAPLPQGQAAGIVSKANSIELPAPSSSRVVILGASYALGWKLDTAAGLRVMNNGMAGQQSFEMAERFDRDVLAHAPRAVILWGFINDVFRAPRADIETALAKARDSYTMMIAKGRAAGLDVILATEVTITDRSHWMDRLRAFAGRLLGRPGYVDYVNGHVIAMNAWLREKAQRNGLLLLDFERLLSAPHGHRRPEFAVADGSHLTEVAYDALTQYTAPILERHFRRNADPASVP